MPTDFNPDEVVFAACGGRIDTPQRYPFAIYRGQHVYFCTTACLKAFQKDPDRFMAGEIEHPNEEESLK
jgi:YHS domain-containing protein